MTGNIDITLGIARGTGNAQRVSGKGGLNPEQKLKIFERDRHTCRCCGFQAQKYQDVHYLNGVVADTKPDNLATLCIFCHQCFNLDRVSEMRSGILIWLPEISQEDLHHITRAVYVARISQGPVADAARQTLDLLMQRRNEATRRLGTDDPYVLASVLRDYISDRAYDMRSKKLEGLRLFPLDRRIIKETDLEFNQFPQILAYWRSKDGPFGGQVLRHWISLYRDLAA